MVTVLEMFNFAIGALCGGGFPNFDHGETRVEGFQVAHEGFHFYWAFFIPDPLF